MKLDDYSVRELENVYADDVPYVLHPYWANYYIKNASEGALRSCFAFCSNTVVSDINSGQAVLVRNRYSGSELFGVVDFDGQPKSDLPLFFRERLRRVIEGQLTRPYFTVSAPKMAEVEFESSTLDDGLSQHEKQRKQNHKDNAAAYADVQARKAVLAEKPVKNTTPSYGNDPDFIKGYVEHSDNKDLSGILSLTPLGAAADVADAGKSFINDPTLINAAMVGVALIPGKVADKVIDAIPINKIIKKPEKKTKEKIVKPVIKEKAGEKGNWNKALQNPKPNTIYEVECVHKGKKVFYTYETDELGRTISVKGKLELSPIESKERNYLKRHPKGQVKHGGAIAKSEGKMDSYDGGHAVGTVFMGPAEKINIVPQLSKENRHGGWANMEGEWRKNLKSGQSVDVEIKFAYDGDSKVPSKILGEYKMGKGKPKEFTFSN